MEVEGLLKHLFLSRTFVLGDGSAIVGEAIGAVAECPATTGGTIIPIFIIELPNLTGIHRSFVFPGGRHVVVVVGTVPIAMVPVLKGLETLFHLVVQLTDMCSDLLHTSIVGLHESGKSDDILFHLRRLVGRSGKRKRW